MANCLFCGLPIPPRPSGRDYRLRTLCDDDCWNHQRTRKRLRDRALITEGVQRVVEIPGGLWIEVDRLGLLLPVQSSIPVYAVQRRDTSTVSALEDETAVDLQRLHDHLRGMLEKAR